MMRVEVTTRGLVDSLDRLAVRADGEIASAVFRTGAQLQTLVRAKASSAYHPSAASARRGHIPGTGPGPNVFTGDYRRSITLTTGYQGAMPVAVVGTNAPQARALEYGRPGHQPPYPHWRPAAFEIERTFTAAVKAAISKVVNGQ